MAILAIYGTGMAPIYPASIAEQSPLALRKPTLPEIYGGPGDIIDERFGSTFSTCELGGAPPADKAAVAVFAAGMEGAGDPGGLFEATFLIKWAFKE